MAHNCDSMNSPEIMIDALESCKPPVSMSSVTLSTIKTNFQYDAFHPTHHILHNMLQAVT